MSSIGAKRCVQCGILKEQDNFRRYTYSKQNHTEGTYRICKDCEAINSQYKRAKKVVEENGPDANAFYKARTTLAEICSLYDILENNGLRTPRNVAAKPVTTENKKIEQIKRMYSADTQPSAPPILSTLPPPDVAIPEELEQWLTVDPDVWVVAGFMPEYLQETIYESLKAKYRPRIGTDKDTFLPIFDDTYKDILNKILRKFDDYEETYAISTEIQD